MDTPWGTIIWQQFGAAIDILDRVLRACPDQRWRDSLWDDPTDAPEYTEFWFVVYHALYWLDLYLSVSREGFAPPAPFLAGSLPEKPYTKGVLQACLVRCRQKCRTTLESLSDEAANLRCQFPWGEEVSFAELQLYSTRHVQEHASQLSLHLGKTVGSAPDWVARANRNAA
jgi:hypothetical protein